MDRLSNEAFNRRKLSQQRAVTSGSPGGQRVGMFGVPTEDPYVRNAEQINSFKARRARSNREKLGNTSVGGDAFAAMPRFYNPTEYWEFSQIPYDVQRDDHRFKLYSWLDLFYRTHYLIPILVDIFTRFPLVGMELHCKDQKLTEFYEDIFFDRLDYPQFLVDMGREYWTFGQSFPLGSFNEILGVWEREELIDPRLVRIEQVPILGTTQLHIQPPPGLVEIAKTKRPKELYYKLISEHPDLMPYLVNDKPMPVSDVLMKQVANKVSPRDTHGTPILLRALRTLMHEEKLLASQDAIAERLYSPLILAKLGATDLGDGMGAWVPGQDELGAFRDDLDIALSSDFRLLVHHFAVEISNVFGREQMPRLDTDFDRIERRLMNVFGVNPSLLSGGVASQPYASSALNAEFLNQILRTFQGYLKRHYESRAAIVAEAQEHHDYEKRGEERVPVMEEVVEYDEEGKPYIVTKHKLLYPELRMKVLDLRDEATQRNFVQQLKAQGVPMSDQTMAMGMDFNFDEELDKSEEELIKKTVRQQEAKVKAYRILQAKGLPIPADLKAEVEGMEGFGPEGGAGMGGPGGPMAPIPPMGGGGMMMPPPPMGGGGMGLGGPPLPGGTLGVEPGMTPRNPMRGTFPEESTQRMGPQMVNPAGNPGGMGVPRTPSRITSAYEEEDNTLVKRLPRKKADGASVPPKVKPYEEAEADEVSDVQPGDEEGR